MDGGPSQVLGKWAVELAAGTLQVPWESAIHSLTYSFTYLSIVNCVSGIEPVAGTISHRNMTQSLEFTVHLPEGLQDVAEIMSCVQLLRLIVRTSLVVQWLRICLPMQGTQVQSLVREHASGHATGQLSLCNTTKEPVLGHQWTHILWSPCSAAREAHSPQLEKARAPQQKPSIANVYVYVYINMDLGSADNCTTLCIY